MNVVLNGWINTEESRPPLVDGRNYSMNVWGWDGKNILVVALFIEGDFWFWANAYGNVFGEAEFDDDYEIICWQPIVIPLPPLKKLTKSDS